MLKNLKKIPLSLIILSILSIWQALPLLTLPFLLFGAKAKAGENWYLLGFKQSIEISTFVSFLYVLLHLMFVVAVIKRFKWGWKVLLFVYLSMAVNMVVGNFLMFFTNPEAAKIAMSSRIAVYLTTIIFSSVFILLSVLVYRKRSYFTK